MTTALTALTMLLIVQTAAPLPDAPPPRTATETPQATVTVTGEKSFRVLFTSESEKEAPAELAAFVAATAQRLAETRTAERKVVCGMVVIQADPSVDPKIVKQVPGDPATMKIRRIPAAACTD
jgi:hypothetical protein